MPKQIIETGQVYGRLTVIGRGPNADRRARWVCRCECEKISLVWTSSLTRGRTKSCGCLNAESRRLPKKHGLYVGGKVPPEMSSLNSAISRCDNPNSATYSQYGAKGISVCREWRDDPRKFIAEVGKRPSPKHTLDRIDGTKGYEPGNCRWATPAEQNQNTSRAILVPMGGKMVTLAEYCRETGTHYGRMRSRMRDRGASFEDALATVNKHARNTKY